MWGKNEPQYMKINETLIIYRSKHRSKSYKASRRKHKTNTVMTLGKTNILGTQKTLNIKNI